jgi:rod shape-determining protein MreC
MPVITYQGYLVGRVENVGSNSAQIRLIIDHNFVVGGIVARTDSREIGLVKGSGRGDRPNIMDSIAWDADIKAGDVVLTSGLSNNFPPGLKIGEVAEVETDNYGLSQKADINLFMHQITLEEVMIIKNFNSEITVQNNQAENEAEINVAEESETNDGNSESEAN